MVFLGGLYLRQNISNKRELRVTRIPNPIYLTARAQAVPLDSNLLPVICVDFPSNVPHKDAWELRYNYRAQVHPTRKTAKLMKPAE